MILSEKEIRDFETYLFRNEKEAGTIRTYLTVVRQFVRFLDGRELERDLVIDYKAKIISENAPSTVNSKIGPVNIFLRFLQHPEMCIKRLRIQRQMYCPDEKQLSYDEYLKLIQVSEQQGNYRMSLALQILGSTGIRIGELKYITLEAAKIGRCVVRNKGKTRIVLLPDALRGKSSFTPRAVVLPLGL